MKNNELPENVGGNEGAQSQFKIAYELLGAHNPQDLHSKYEKIDQELMKNNEWDYDNQNLLTNKIKILLENTDDSKLSEEEAEWKKSIMWFWYHHATSCAMFRYKDKEKAKMYAEKALEIQDEGNKITKILYLLLHDKLEEAKMYAKTIPRNQILDDGNINPEPETAEELISEYEAGLFFK